MNTVNCNNYDYETDRIKALVLVDNKVYEADQHFEAMLDILEANGYIRDDIFGYDDKTLKAMIGGDAKIAELSIINNKKSLLIYSEEDKKYFEKHYNQLPMYLYQ